MKKVLIYILFATITSTLYAQLSKVSGTGIANLHGTVLVWGDYTNDNKLDLIISGSGKGGIVTILDKNV